MNSYYAQKALLPSGWTDNVRLVVSTDGEITSVLADTKAEESDIQLAGPMIPGMPNCHSHAFQRAFAGLSEYRTSTNDSFWSWRQLMYQFLDKLTPEDCYIIARQLYLEMLKTGYTSVGEFHYLHNDINGSQFDNPAAMSHALIQAAKDVGIRMTLLPVWYRYAGFGKQKPDEAQRRFILDQDQYFELIHGLSNEADNNDFIIGVAPHSLRAVDLEDLTSLESKLNPGTPKHIHISEQKAEVVQCLEYVNQTPIEYLYNSVDVNDSWTLIHATHLTDSELNAVKKSRSVIGICPTTEANLGDGILPGNVFDEDNPAIWSIGSDSHISVDAFEELRLLEYGQRLSTHGRACIGNGEWLWQQAISGGCQSLGYSGQLKAGARADWLVINKDHVALNTMPIEQLLDAAIFSNRISAGSTNLVSEVYVNGQRQLHEQVHADEQSISNQFQSRLKEILCTL